ncbi:heptaprenyl diphosphate synthase component 1 [Lentibacillus sp. L22]|uniref:heptaprenyl diphosphate synthase component 1 n=1 Tax=Lentibacillus TaxID=175304 RepID=UPI0022B11645|nr:heptaprenyl diphosphate synthase component 1 [Lentibacillus daqui]
MNTLDKQMKKYKALINKHMQHTYLDKYIRSAIIPEEKLFVLLSVINTKGLSESQKDTYIITAMLVQIALDTHDTVVKVTDPAEGKQEKRRKQLSVLAGDYYSGLYYSLLANSNDFDMIHVLATAIKEINEAKMNLYYLATDSLEKYVQIVKKVESLLFVRIAMHVNEFAIIGLLENWLLENRLVHEKQCLQNKGYSPLFAWWPKDESVLSANLESIIDRLHARIKTEIEEIPSSYHDLSDRITAQLNDHSTIRTKQAEEG